jgi:peptidyl-prolyl cis-trans isomerase A (cyclophilin A)
MEENQENKKEKEIVSDNPEAIKEPDEKSISKTTIFIICAIVLVIIITGLYYSNMLDKKDSKNDLIESNPRVLLVTSVGDIVLELDYEKAPITVENFLNYVKNEHYDNTVFHRVIKGFMVQGGGFLANGTELPTNDPIKLESGNGLKNELGTVAMARTNVPDSATSQFFINTANNEFLNKGARDDGYAVFGKVIEGMDVVTKIENSQTGVKNRMSDWPNKDITIIKAELIE